MLDPERTVLANVTAEQLRAGRAIRVAPGSFEPSRHFYPRALNAQLHPMVAFFMRMSRQRIASRYCHLNPRVVPEPRRDPGLPTAIPALGRRRSRPRDVRGRPTLDGGNRDKAYDLYNADLAASGLEIRTPETIRDVVKNEVPLWVQRFGGHAVVKVPYANAGQGVYTITNDAELAAFTDSQWEYERYIVQSLIGNHSWSSISRRGRLYHVGTMPNRRNQTFVADVRMMVCATASGFRPLAVYARRARLPLVERLVTGTSWDVLGTNLSSKRADGGWDSDAGRLMLMDRKDFNLLGIGLDELIDGFIQAVLSAIAIDRLAYRLVTQKGRLRRRLFRSLNDDPTLLDELDP